MKGSFRQEVEDTGDFADIGKISEIEGGVGREVVHERGCT